MIKRSQRRPFRYSVIQSEPVALPDAAQIEPPPRSINVRSAKDHLSSLLEEAALGNEVIITSDGLPKARLVPVRERRKPYRVDWAWLRSQPVTGGPAAEALIRADQDGRD